MGVVQMLLISLAFLCTSNALLQQGEVANAANPIRKVVNMLQAMQKKVTAEAEKEKELYDKFMCYCKNSGGDLSTGISGAETKIPTLGSDIKEAEAKKKQLDEDLKTHQVDRSAAKEAMAKASSIRQKEADAFAKEKADLTANLDAMGKAIKAITSGMAGGFLQTETAQVLKKVALSDPSLLEADRQDVMAFLSGGQDGQYVPQSGQITGILKTLHDEMSKSLADSEAAEAAAVESFEALMSAKTKEVNANTKAIETKTVRVGELAVEIVQMKNDLTDTEEQLLEDKKFLGDLEKNCETQTKDMEERSKTRSEELLALAETIKVLNDDDALEMFKKTLPGAGASFVQMAENKAAAQKRALAAIRALAKHPHRRPEYDFIALAIQGKKMGFDKVIKMIDGLVATLKQEQVDDDSKKEYCNKQFDFSEDKKKGLQQTVSDLETSIEEAKEGIATLKEEIEALEKSIKKLDKSVAEATEQRKAEHEDYTELMASDSAAKELLKFAMNRLNKFYNPKLYKAPPKRVLSEEDQITVSMGGTLAPTAAPGGIAGTGVAVLAEIRAHTHRKDAPPPAPEGLPAYSKKSEESNGVIAMINLLIKDLDKEMTEAETAEKDAQADYEQMLSDSAEKRTLDSKALTEKTGAKASLETDLEADKETKASTVKELMATEQYISSLHGECDWLLQYFDARKAARTSEIESLGNAKAVLSGADFSFLQQKTSTANSVDSCIAEDLKHRAALQNKLAGVCVDMCKEVGAYPKCTCPDFVPPDSTPGVMTWPELLEHMDNLSEWGHGELKAWSAQASHLQKSAQASAGNLRAQGAQTEAACLAADVAHRVQVQNKLAGVCVDMCKEVGAYPTCTCPDFVAPDSTPGVMTWPELLEHMDNLSEWGHGELKAWSSVAR